MKVHVLGSSSGEPVPHRYASAYLVESDGLQFLMDAGDGVAQQIVRYSIDPCLIDAVVISHTHPDHVGGLLLLLQRIYISKRSKPLHIYLPGGLLPGFQDIFPYFNIFTERWPFRFDLKPISESIFFQDRGFRIEAIQNGHVTQTQSIASKSGVRAESFSFALMDANQRKMLYTADIDDIECLRSVMKDTHVLLSECAHIDPQHVIDFAVQHDVVRVSFTHIPPDREDSIMEFKSDQIDVRVVQDGDVIDV